MPILEDPTFDAKCRVLEFEQIRHIDEEEAVLLPKAKRALGREKLAELGSEMERVYQGIMRSEPRRNIPREAEGTPAVL